MTFFEQAKQYGVIPVIKIPAVEYAVPLAKALIDGGLPLIEVTMRNECAADCIKAIKEAYPEMSVAAGTVLSAELVRKAKQAGAELCVAPGLNTDVLEECRREDIPLLPGCVTATEIENGMKHGLDTFKFFPAEQLGGVKTIKELAGPYSGVSFIPTSGITMDNLGGYLSNSNVAAVGGSFMAPAAKILDKDWDGIRKLCEQAVAAVHNFRLIHIGINAGDQGAALAEELGGLFAIGSTAGGKSDFAGTIFECCKVPFPGAHGHIAIGTRSVERAVAYLEKKGMKMREEFKNYDAAGNLNAVYLEKEFSGFAIHLLRKP